MLLKSLSLDSKPSPKASLPPPVFGPYRSPVRDRTPYSPAHPTTPTKKLTELDISNLLTTSLSVSPQKFHTQHKLYRTSPTVQPPFQPSATTSTDLFITEERKSEELFPDSISNPSFSPSPSPSPIPFTSIHEPSSSHLSSIPDLIPEESSSVLQSLVTDFSLFYRYNESLNPPDSVHYSIINSESDSTCADMKSYAIRLRSLVLQVGPKNIKDKVNSIVTVVNSCLSKHETTENSSNLKFIICNSIISFIFTYTSSNVRKQDFVRVWDISAFIKELIFHPKFSNYSEFFWNCFLYRIYNEEPLLFLEKTKDPNELPKITFCYLFISTLLHLEKLKLIWILMASIINENSLNLNHGYYLLYLVNFCSFQMFIKYMKQYQKLITSISEFSIENLKENERLFKNLGQNVPFNLSDLISRLESRLSKFRINPLERPENCNVV
ncbi:hypothetical protein RCL1_005392 [Eukaryota sp. TZLM3-RCL]